MRTARRIYAPDGGFITFLAFWSIMTFCDEFLLRPPESQARAHELTLAVSVETHHFKGGISCNV